MESGKVIGFFHAGITVKNLEASLDFYCNMLNLELVRLQDSSQDYIREMLSLPGLQKIKIALLKVPGSDVMVELLEYVGVERFPGNCRPCDYGSGHICLFVTNLEEIYREFVEKGVRFRSGPVHITAGVNTGAKAIYMMDPDGYIVELVERPK